MDWAWIGKEGDPALDHESQRTFQVPRMFLCLASRAGQPATWEKSRQDVDFSSKRTGVEAKSRGQLFFMDESSLAGEGDDGQATAICCHGQHCWVERTWCLN